MEVEANKREYTWIKAQTRLEHITCLTRKRRQDVIGLRRDAYDWIDSTGYRGLALRSLGFMTEPYVAADSRSVLWRRAQQGMNIFWSNPLPVIRVYAFYYTLAASARESGDLQTALAILREGTLLLKNSGLNLRNGHIYAPGNADPRLHGADIVYLRRPAPGCNLYSSAQSGRSERGYCFFHHGDDHDNSTL